MGGHFIVPIALAFLAAGPAISVGQAGDSDEAYLKRFHGQWSATGAVRENAKVSARKVSCSLTGSNAGTRAAIRGTCTAHGLFTREIGVELKVDPRTGRYSGVYTGSKAGPVRLSGTRSGDVLTLDATWPMEVNGDRQATMIIRSPGPGRFTFVVIDKPDRSSPSETMTNLTLAAL